MDKKLISMILRFDRAEKKSHYNAILFRQIFKLKNNETLTESA